MRESGRTSSTAASSWACLPAYLSWRRCEEEVLDLTLSVCVVYRLHSCWQLNRWLGVGRLLFSLLLPDIISLWHSICWFRAGGLMAVRVFARVLTWRVFHRRGEFPISVWKLCAGFCVLCSELRWITSYWGVLCVQNCWHRVRNLWKYYILEHTIILERLESKKMRLWPTRPQIRECNKLQILIYDTILLAATVLLVRNYSIYCVRKLVEKLVLKLISKSKLYTELAAKTVSLAQTKK
jgi:hypothetical protein